MKIPVKIAKSIRDFSIPISVFFFILTIVVCAVTVTHLTFGVPLPHIFGFIFWFLSFCAVCLSAIMGGTYWVYPSLVKVFMDDGAGRFNAEIESYLATICWYFLVGFSVFAYPLLSMYLMSIGGS